MQPFRTWSTAAGAEVLAALPDRERLMLPALQAVQEAFGFVPADAVPLVARTLNVSVAETYGVLTYYRDLRTAPSAPVTVTVCVAEACQSTGSRGLLTHVSRTLAPPGGRSDDGAVDVADVYCLGNCALGPAVTVAGRLIGRATPELVDAAVARAVASAGDDALARSITEPVTRAPA